MGGWDAAALIGGIVAVLTALIGGFWKWMGERKRVHAEAQKVGVDAQAAVINGFVLLLNELRSEREVMVRRIDELETSNRRRDHRIGLLERLLGKHDIDVPPEEN